MLKIYDKDHNAIGHIVKYKDLKIESDVSTGDRSLSFTYLARYKNIEPEFYVETPEDEFVIKEKSVSTDGFLQFTAALNLEGLEAKPWASFSVKDSTIDDAARLALAGTGWTVGECTVTKKRNAGMLQVSALQIIGKLCTAFMCECVYDTKNKTVSFYDTAGEDRGVYFMRAMNLKRLTKKSESYDYYTRLIPIGADGLTIEEVNGGKNYLENHQYSDKVKTYIWKDESYTDAQAMKEDGEKKLEDLSKPRDSYSVEVIDLAKQKPGYSVLSFRLGDVVHLIDAETRINSRQRIMKLTEYPQEPEKNKCELSNTFLNFEELQQKYKEAAEIVNAVMTDDGKIKVSDILRFEEGIAGSSAVGGIQGNLDALNGELAQVKLTVGAIETNYLKAEEADLRFASIDDLHALSVTVHSIEGDYASFKSLTAEEFAAHTGRVDSLTGKLSSFEKQISDEMITAKGWMAEGSIGDAQISSVSANKLRAGTIDTSAVTVASGDGRLQIADNTMQISDAARVRVQIGKDAGGDYTLSVWDAAGNLIWDALGATGKTIQRKIIRDSVVAEDAGIQGHKLDINSVVRSMNGASEQISSTVIQAGDKTLNVLLEEQNNTITEQGKTLTAQAAQIKAAEGSIALKVSSQEFESYKETAEADHAAVRSRLSAAETELSAMDGKIALKVSQTEVESYVAGTLESYSTTAQMQSAIELSKDSITSIVAGSYATKGELAQTETIARQNADKFSWIVKSGTSGTDFTLTDRVAQLITNSLVIKDSTGASTVISGGKLNANQIFANAITAAATMTGAFTATNATVYGVIYAGNNKSAWESEIGLKLDDGAITCYRAKTNKESMLDFSANYADGTWVVLEALNKGIRIKCGEMQAAQITASLMTVNGISAYAWSHFYGGATVHGAANNPFAVNSTANNEGSIQYQYNGTAKWSAGPGTAGIGVDTFGFFKYGIGNRATLDSSGIFSTTRISCGHTPQYDQSIGCSNWFRSSGATGWYNDTYGGGIFMNDSTCVQVFGGKAFKIPNSLTVGYEIISQYYDKDWRMGIACGTGDTSKWGFYNTITGAVLTLGDNRSSRFYGGLTVDGNIVSTGVMNNTNANAPNMYIRSDTGKMYRTTASSRRYKNGIKDVESLEINPHKLYDIPVREYYYNPGYVSDDPEGRELHIGFIAEEVAEHYPIAAEYNEDGSVEMWNIKEMFPAALYLIQEQKEEIRIWSSEVQENKKEIGIHEARICALEGGGRDYLKAQLEMAMCRIEQLEAQVQLLQAA